MDTIINRCILFCQAFASNFKKLYNNPVNKAQKIITTIWVILIPLIFLATINPLIDQFGYGTGYSPNWGQFLGLSIIVSIPSFILFKVWKDKK